MIETEFENLSRSHQVAERRALQSQCDRAQQTQAIDNFTASLLSQQEARLAATERQLYSQMIQVLHDLKEAVLPVRAQAGRSPSPTRSVGPVSPHPVQHAGHLSMSPALMQAAALRDGWGLITEHTAEEPPATSSDDLVGRSAPGTPMWACEVRASATPGPPTLSEVSEAPGAQTEHVLPSSNPTAFNPP